jgi:transcriptional regulator with XRE-family HTH domain
MSSTHLWRIEHGERALDLSEIAVLADALQIAASELIKLPIPAPANGETGVHYGRALSRLRGRRDDAVWALRRAELISPHQVQRDPLARDIVGELLARTRRDSPVGRELRRMAARAGLPM